MIQSHTREQGLECKSSKSCIREAGKLELIDSVKKRFKSLDNKNFINHTYNEKTADKIYNQISKFSQEIDNLLKNNLFFLKTVLYQNRSQEKEN